MSPAKRFLADEDFFEAGMAQGVRAAAAALCDLPEISSVLKTRIREEKLGQLLGRDVHFSDKQADQILQKLMDAVLEVATGASEMDQCPDAEGEEAEAADGGVADHASFQVESGEVKAEPPEPEVEEQKTYRPRDLHMKRLERRGAMAPPSPPMRMFNPLDDLKGIEFTFAMVAGKNVAINAPQDLLAHMVYEFCSSISSTVEEDVRALQQYAGLRAISKKKMHLRGYCYDGKTGLTLPKLGPDELLRAVFRMARAAGLPVEIGVVKGAIPPAVPERFSYTYDPEALHAPAQSASVDEPVCGPGMIFRFRYADTGEIRSYYVAKGADDDKVMTNGTEMIANGSPLATAALGLGPGDSVDIGIASKERHIQILDVWDPAASGAVIEIN
ncbi:hypothetical protein LCGC14_0408300 [marine sediment metagenome]|uniref:Uncharacterized protein n=2 Tax=root TaxID=1 RepID=A0A7V1FNS5_9RHOB|nr:hypothetical protein [Sulfitobacter litoralis]HDZ53028.1 hypothetical protein [Sulfitobacter litoralis]